MDNVELRSAINKLQPGLKKYQMIMELFPKVNTKEDLEFQRVYKDFYGFRHPKAKEFSVGFFEYLEDNKLIAPRYEDVLKHLKQFGRIEASFASKLIATIDPEKPVIDRYVLKNIGLKMPYAYTKDRFNRIIKLYDDVVNWYTYFWIQTKQNK